MVEARREVGGAPLAVEVDVSDTRLFYGDAVVSNRARRQRDINVMGRLEEWWWDR